MRFHYPFYCFSTRQYPAAAHSKLLQQHRRTFAHRQLVVHYQYRQPVQLLMLLLLFQLQLQWYRHSKYTASTGAALHLDRAVHHLHDVLSDRQTQSRTLYLTDTFIFSAGKRFKNMLHILIRHPDPVISKNKFVITLCWQLRF